MTIQSVCISQDSSKVWIPRKDALKVLAAADSGRIYMNYADQLKKDIDTLNKIISLKQSQINNLLNADKSNQDAIILLKNQTKELNDKIISDEKLLRKQQRKKKLALLGGSIGMAALGVLYFLK